MNDVSRPKCLQRFGDMNAIWTAFPDAIQAHLKPHLSNDLLPQGAICFNAGDAVERVYFPACGLISLLIPAGGDKLVEAGLIGGEGAVGLQSAVWSRPSFTRAVVQVPGMLWSVPAEPLRRAFERSDEGKRLVSRYTEILWAEAQQLAACNAVHRALQRLARWLLQAADRSQSNQLPLTQEFLAKMLGVRRTSVTMLALQLRDCGIIEYNRGKIVILDRATLEAAACPCYQIIRDLHRRGSGSLGVAPNTRAAAR